MFGPDLSFELYDDVIGAVHYVDHLRKEFRVKDLKGDTWFIALILFITWVPIRLINNYIKKAYIEVSFLSEKILPFFKSRNQIH